MKKKPDPRAPLIRTFWAAFLGSGIVDTRVPGFGAWWDKQPPRVRELSSLAAERYATAVLRDGNDPEKHLEPSVSELRARIASVEQPLSTPPVSNPLPVQNLVSSALNVPRETSPPRSEFEALRQRMKQLYG